jgi:hypothetical protein
MDQSEIIAAPTLLSAKSRPVGWPARRAVSTMWALPLARGG